MPPKLESRIGASALDETASVNKPLPGVTPTKIDKASPASLCSVFIRKFCATPSGERQFGDGTGFHYRDSIGRSWLITNWHVLTGRRPDDPGRLLSEAPRSPYRIEVTYPGPEVGQFLPPASLLLYEGGHPIWSQYRLETGTDVVGIPVTPPKEAINTHIQDFAERDRSALQAGMDVTVIGFPFEQGKDMPFPIWKRAMVASEPAYLALGAAQTLLDSPGAPGMSGSPVYRIATGMRVTREQHRILQDAMAGKGSILDALSAVDIKNPEDGIALKWVGVYAGARGVPGMEKLSLGRMMFASTVDLITMHGEPGHNPFPPEECDAQGVL